MAAEILAERQDVKMEDEEEEDKKPYDDLVLEETEVSYAHYKPLFRIRNCRQDPDWGSDSAALLRYLKCLQVSLIGPLYSIVLSVPVWSATLIGRSFPYILSRIGRLLLL